MSLRLLHYDFHFVVIGEHVLVNAAPRNGRTEVHRLSCRVARITVLLYYRAAGLNPTSTMAFGGYRL